MTEGTIIAKPLDSKFSNDEKQAILAWGNILLRQIKDNFTQPLNVKEIIDELEISKDDYYRALSNSKAKDL